MAAINPVPSLIRASAQDAANAQMRRNGRSAWDESDAALACETQDRLVRSAYGRPSDHNDPNLCFLRFQVAERMERRGDFSLRSTLEQINAAIDAALG